MREVFAAAEGWRQKHFSFPALRFSAALFFLKGQPRVIGQSESRSFLALLSVHDALNEQFLLHQEALLALDVELALERLLRFENGLRKHMKVEEELLLPVYQRAGRIQGGPIEFFTGEHTKMLEFIGLVRARLTRLAADRAGLRREIIALFDQEATFKQLVDHHDQRERNILYPTLDRVTSKEERDQLLARCSIL